MAQEFGEKKKRTYKRINYEDRKKIKEMLSIGYNVEFIAYNIGVNRATMYRELKRGGVANEVLKQHRYDRYKDLYDPDTAQKAIWGNHKSR